MDALITYVNGNDPHWQRTWTRSIGRPQAPNRFRDWGALPYLLRSIETFCPFIDKLFLVVSDEYQVPAFINPETVRIVHHNAMIPAEYLPTFNSNVIEHFFHNIRALDEQFLYFNDDVFVNRPCTPEDFFSDGRIRASFILRNESRTMYQQFLHNASDLAHKAAGAQLPPMGQYYRCQHTVAPLLKSLSSELDGRLRTEMRPRLTRVRDWNNVTLTIFAIYGYLTGRAVDQPLDGRYFSMARETIAEAVEELEHPTAATVCLNDLCKAEDFQDVRSMLHTELQKKFPKKSRYEL